MDGKVKSAQIVVVTEEDGREVEYRYVVDHGPRLEIRVDNISPSAKPDFWWDRSFLSAASYDITLGNVQGYTAYRTIKPVQTEDHIERGRD